MKSVYSAGLLALLLVSCSAPQQGNSEEAKADVNYREAIEVIASAGVSVDSVLSALVPNELVVYSWENHSVIFGEIENVHGLTEQIKSTLPDVVVKEYLQPLYAYDKTLHCENSAVVDDWKDYLLTANLVMDTVMQQEYIEYHDTQFERWPEVAQGFCNADFQQLLVYKTGRQLLLVISIPADNTLAELNPKTVENNPRVDDWNAIMGKYQEGIPGTKEGEVWVFLEENAE